jgi:hypothetical protein
MHSRARASARTITAMRSPPVSALALSPFMPLVIVYGIAFERA